MAWYIKRASRVDPDITVYYKGNGQWTDNIADKATYTSQAKCNTARTNNDGKNGGWNGSTAVSE